MCTEMPWSEWPFVEQDLNYLENWLLQPKRDSHEHNLATLLLERLNYSEVPLPFGVDAATSNAATNGSASPQAQPGVVPPIDPSLHHRLCLMVLRSSKHHLSSLWESPEHTHKTRGGVSSRIPALNIGYQLVLN